MCDLYQLVAGRIFTGLLPRAVSPKQLRASKPPHPNHHTATGSSTDCAIRTGIADKRHDPWIKKQPQAKSDLDLVG